MRLLVQYLLQDSLVFDINLFQCLFLHNFVERVGSIHEPIRVRPMLFILNLLYLGQQDVVFDLDLFLSLIFEVGGLSIFMEHMLIGLVQKRVSIGRSRDRIKLSPMSGEFAHVLGFFNFILEYGSSHNILYERRFISKTRKRRKF